MASSHSRTWHSSTGWGIRSPRLPSPATRPTGSASSQASTCCGPKPGPRPTNVPARRRWHVPCGRERDRPARPQRGRHGEGGRRLPAPLEAHRFRNQPQGGIWDARGLTCLQTAAGPNAGNVVLGMLADGTLHPGADPVEQPDPPTTRRHRPPGRCCARTTGVPLPP